MVTDKIEKPSPRGWRKGLIKAVKKRYGKSLPWVLITMAVALLVIALDPLGLNAASNLRSKTSFYRFTSAFYPTSGRDHVTVVLIDDQSVTSEYMQWPVQFSQYDELLSVIGMYNPAAVFFDTLFLDKRGDDIDLNNFAQTIAFQKEAGVPVYVMENTVLYANPTPEKCARSNVPILEPIRNAAASVAFSAYEGFGDAYPIYNLSPCGPSDVINSPAALLYLQACKAGLTKNCPPGDDDLAMLKHFRADFKEPLSVRWGRGAAPISKTIYPDSFVGTATLAKQNKDGTETVFCEEDIQGRWGKFLKAGEEIGAGLFGSLPYLLGLASDKPKTTVCLYHAHIKAHDIFDFHEIARSQEGDAEEHQQALRALFENKLVLIGMRLSGMNDFVVSPVHGQVPGVFMHAMALDNLLTYGEGYLRPPEDLFLRASDNDGLEIMFVVICEVLAIVAVVKGRKPKKDKQRSSKYPNWVRWVITGVVFCLIGILILIVALALLWLGVAGLDYEPLNWSALIFFGWGTLLLISRELKENMMRGADD